MTGEPKKLFAAAVVALFATGAAFAQDEVYEGGSGLITLEGPTGMFINPTSGVVPENYGTLQYCIFLPNQTDDLFDTKPAIGHGVIGAYGVSDGFEIGVQGTYIDPDAGDELTAIGPNARYRIMKDVEDGSPEVSVGAYSRFGDEALQKWGGYLAAAKRATFEGPIRSAAVHGGVRATFLEEGEVDEVFAAYAGLELELPLRIYAVGEIQPYTSDDDIVNPAESTPYAFGLQWRAAGIAMSVAGIQNGGTEDISFYYGIGTGLSF